MQSQTTPSSSLVSALAEKIQTVCSKAKDTSVNLRKTLDKKKGTIDMRKQIGEEGGGIQFMVYEDEKMQEALTLKLKRIKANGL